MLQIYVFNLLNRKQMIAVKKVRLILPDFYGGSALSLLSCAGKHIPAQQVGDSLSYRWSLDPAASPSRVAARPPRCALLWKGVKVLLQEPLALSVFPAGLGASREQQECNSTVPSLCHGITGLCFFVDSSYG